MMAFNKEISPSLRTQFEKWFQNTARDCDGVERFDFVDNQSRTSASYSHALVSVFSSKQALDAYRASAAHSKMMAELGYYIKEIAVLDTDLEQHCRL
ncbi:Dabb family protein (plasmid) [Paraburkholderia sp. A2RO-4L]